MKSSLASSNSLAGFSFENILEAFLAGTNNGFMILDKELRILHFNAAYSHFHQTYTGNNLITGSLLSDVYTPNGVSEVIGFIKKALKGEASKFSRKFPPVNNGCTSWFDIEYYPLKSDSGKIEGVGIGVFETTEKHLSEERRKQSEELFKTLILNSTDAFLLADVDFELTYISDNLYNVLGFESGELLRKNGLDIAHPDDVDRVKEWFKTVTKQDDKLLSIEYRVKNKEGQWIWVENFARNRLNNGSVNAIVMNLRNIQAKKLADQALVQSEQRLSLLLNNTAESFIILNSRLRIVAYNHAAQEHSPYFFKKELQSGRSILDLVDASEMEMMIALFEKVFDGEQVERETTYGEDKKNQHIYSHIYRPLFDKEDDIFGVFITSNDITQRKRAEQQVKDSEIRFKTIIQESFDAVLITDAETKMIYSSPSITNVLGYRAEDLEGKRGFDYIHPSFLRAMHDKFQEVLQSPNSEKNIDVKMRHINDEYIWIEVKAKNMFHNEYVKGILISLRDITYRKKAEEIISLSEQRFKGLVQSGADMIAILDVNCVVQYTSPTIKTIIGIDPATLNGKNILDHVHPDDLQYVKEKFDGLMISHRTQSYIGPYRYRNDDGKYFWLESTITNLLGDPSIKGIVLNSRDITERKKLTEDLAVNAERLETAQRIAKLGYFEYDFRTVDYFLSEEFYDILGLTQEIDLDLDYRMVEELIHPEDRDKVRAEVEKAVHEARDFNTEFRLRVKTGEQKVVSAIGMAFKNRAGIVEKYTVTLQDITDKRMATLALQTLEGRFTSLFENSIDGILITVDSGEIISANPAICRMLGYTSEEMLQIKRADLLDVESPSVQELLAAKARDEMFVGEILVRHKEGYQIPIELASTSMKDAEGNRYYSNIIRDITEKKKIEEEQRSLTQELVKNNQDLQQFSFITSHNLRAPVANLISLLSLYDKENPAEEFNKLLIDKFEEATLQLNNTLNDLINVLVIKSNTNVEKEALTFSSTFDIVKKNIENLLSETGGDIETDFSEVDSIKYNKIHLESIFLNLISNAIRYRSPDRAPQIKIRSCRQDQWVIVSFSDNGLGIDLKRYGGRLFGLYQRFHQSKEGKGLGLYMVNSQVVAMGGKIEVESEPMVGTTFKIFFKS